MNRYYSLYTEENGSELHIYGDITSYKYSENDVSSYSIAKELSELDISKPLTVYINSYGGEVAEGLAIYNQLKRFENCKTVVDGFAASIASVIFMAGKERIMSPSSLLFIHNAWTMAAGNADELRKTADDLEKITSASIGAYMEHVNISEDKLKELLDAETWLSADEAVEMGFATEKAVSQASGKPSQSARDRFVEMWQKSRTPKAPPEPKETPMQKFFKSMAKRKDD